MVLHTTRHKIGHFGNVSPSQPLGLVWKKLKTNESTHSPIKRNVLQHKKTSKTLARFSRLLRHPVRKRSRSILKGGHNWWFNRQPCRSISDADLNEHVDGGRRGDIECADATALDVVGLERDARVVVADVAKHEAANVCNMTTIRRFSTHVFRSPVSRF